MNRTIGFDVNHYAPLPASLSDGNGRAVTELTFPIEDVFHHYYIAKYGSSDKDRGTYECADHLTAGPDWRFLGSGIGRDKESKRNVSNELAKGFARWFLYEHEGYTYFCPVDDLLDRPALDGSTWVRAQPGDLPDYVCGPNDTTVRVLEVKGRYSSVSFTNQEFTEFRNQLLRAELRDPAGRRIALKTFVIASRWATEESPRVRAGLFVEDPRTPGRDDGDHDQPSGRNMVAGHYASIFSLLALPLHAAALRRGFQIPEVTGERRAVWRCLATPYQGKLFVGGVLPQDPCASWDFRRRLFIHHVTDSAGRITRIHEADLELRAPRRFFGLAKGVFEDVRRVCTAGLANPDTRIGHVDAGERPASGMTLLRDGTVMGPESFFEPVDVMPL